MRDKFKIIRELGRGGMSVVYLAQQIPLGREVAVKHMRKELSQDEELIKRFYREAEILATLNHPNIARIYEFFQDRSGLYIVMEYVRGFPLSRLLKKISPLKLAEALTIGIEIAKGLRYAHAHGIIHRDLKPSNIIITEEGGVKILDFGVAHLEDGEEVLTAPGVALGTPSYMSPEQLRGDKVNEASDVFSFGVVMYEMLTGRRPFESDSTSSASQKILRGEMTPIKKWGIYPAPVERLVNRCLAFEPSKRFHNFNQVLDDMYHISHKFYGYLPGEDVLLKCVIRTGLGKDVPVVPVDFELSQRKFPAGLVKLCGAFILFYLLMWGGHYFHIKVNLKNVPAFAELYINGYTMGKLKKNVVYLRPGVYKLKVIDGGRAYNLKCDLRGKREMKVFVDKRRCE